MNAVTNAEASQIAMAHANALFAKLPVHTSDQINAAYLEHVHAGFIHPEQMIATLHAFHAALVDRFPNVSLWQASTLEEAADDLTNAAACAERDEQL